MGAFNCSVLAKESSKNGLHVYLSLFITMPKLQKDRPIVSSGIIQNSNEIHKRTISAVSTDKHRTISAVSTEKNRKISAVSSAKHRTISAVSTDKHRTISVVSTCRQMAI